MRSLRTVLRFGVALVVAVTACGEDTTGPDEGDGTIRFEATIDGTAWASDAGAVTTGVVTVLPGRFSFTGTQGAGTTVTLTLANIGATGTYPLGVGPSVAGGTATVTTAGGTWTTPFSGNAGTLTVTEVSSSRIVGTFSFTAAATGAATGSKTVTNGRFELEVKPSGSVPPLGENAGNQVTATIGGSAWQAANVGSSFSSGLLAMNASNNQRTLTFSLNGVSAAGTFGVGSGRTITVTNTADAATGSWSSAGAGSSGSVIVTSLTTTRIKGTFSATLAPLAGTQTTGNLVVEGTFDLGR